MIFKIKQSKLLFKSAVIICLLVIVGCQSERVNHYVNPQGTDIKMRIRDLSGYHRIEYPPDSYEYFVQHLKLKTDKAKVYYYNGLPKTNQNHHLAVIDLDIGKEDLQQCADAIMRIRAEYLFRNKQYNRIKFHLTNGFLYEYSKFQEGYRLQVKGNETWLKKEVGHDESYFSFRKYLDIVFTYAGTLSLKAESKPLSIDKIKPGSFFVDNNHAVIVVDVIENSHNKKRAFLLAQSYMPAQSIHILKNPKSENPWYLTDNFKYPLVTPEWTFKRDTLMQN